MARACQEYATIKGGDISFWGQSAEPERQERK
jgi:hypothetical protein